MATASPDPQMLVLLEGVVDALGVIAGVECLHLPADPVVPARRAGRGPRSGTLCEKTARGVYVRGVSMTRSCAGFSLVIAANRIRAGDA